ncbi:serine hydrolase domain-containing protein [Pseudoduganella sp. OTU4001]|uniref:serine hydrolase domain-containing protein n=1 Tax=Pseudoduganella sp. OTU4001 TaxID=3043854 RepID=UPI00313A8718
MRTSLLVLPALLAAACAANAQTLPDVLLKEFHRQSGVTGMAAAIVRDGQLVWHGETGYADAARKQPVTSQTEFRLGSVSKFVTIAMLARLVDQGRIDLQRPVRSYLPNYPAKQYEFTPLQLATHTSGMGHYEYGDEKFDERAEPYKTVTEGLTVFQDRPLRRAPGTAFEYSSYAYNLLSAVMESAARDDFRSMIADTARLAGTPSLQPELVAPVGANWSHLYTPDGEELPRRNITSKWSGGGMLANAPDVARFGLKTLDPAFIKPGTLAWFTTQQKFSNGEGIGGKDFKQAIGWRVSTDYYGRNYFHHAGAILGGRSQVSVFPEQKAAVSLLANVMFTSAVALSTESLYDAYLSASVQGGAKCREGTRRFNAVLRDKPLEGTVRFSREGAFCRADVSADNALGAAVARNGAAPGIVAYSRAGEGNTYFVTPVGIYPGKAAGETLAVQLSQGVVELKLN